MPPTTALLRLGGPPGSGKSTLTKSLGISRARGRLRLESQKDEGAANPNVRTKGLRHVAWTDDKGASYIITDMGGQDEFFLTHQAFIAYDDVPAINAIVVSSLKKDEITEEVRRWVWIFRLQSGAEQQQAGPSPNRYTAGSSFSRGCHQSWSGAPNAPV